MKIADLKRKIDVIDESMKTLRIRGTTRIDWNCLTYEERTLFEKVWELKEEYLPNHPPDDVLEENHDLFVKGIELLIRRAVDLFQEATKAYCMVNSQNEGFFELVYNLRVYWFLYEMRRHFENNRKEDELLEKCENDEEFEQAYAEYLEALEDKTALWSRESFENFTRPFFDASLKKNDKRR
jgi:hypothetical protein